MKMFNKDAEQETCFFESSRCLYLTYRLIDWLIDWLIFPYHWLSLLMASALSSSSLPVSLACSFVFTLSSQSSSSSSGRGRLYSGCLNSASSLEWPLTFWATFPAPISFFSLSVASLSEFFSVGCTVLAFSLWCFSFCGAVGSLWDEEAAEEEEEIDGWCWVFVLGTEEEGEVGKTQPVWRTKRPKNARKRWRARDRHTRPRYMERVDRPLLGEREARTKRQRQKDILNPNTLWCCQPFKPDHDETFSDHCIPLCLPVNKNFYFIVTELLRKAAVLR